MNMFLRASCATAALAFFGAGTASAETVYLDPSGEPLVRPETVSFTPADNGDVVDGLTWDVWADDRAVGHGTEHVKKCVPDCATGGVVSHDVSVVLDQPAPGEDGQARFTHAVVSSTDGVKLFQL
ncbi:MAG: hypothetical protein ACRC20_15835 [Segniliparus sp.]|uniref:hypothetical protein n=1 Tax=Segniliparus sp. TaxID=2804064 RepID=UPI003F2D9911